MKTLDLAALEEKARRIAGELLALSRLEKRQLLVVGCSSSEIAGRPIGSESSLETARAVYRGISAAARQAQVYLAAQCCEHLNRALVLEGEAARLYRLERVNVVPLPKAGGSFATAAYEGMDAPVAVESVTAHVGIDIGDTLIGMHLARVAVPVRLGPELEELGAARVVCARTRPKFIGGGRAQYDEALM